MRVSTIWFAFLLLSTSMLLSSCAWIREHNDGQNPFGISTTGMATATGAAVGTGLGAIVGSQAGSAGGGMAIGALAGAATGAAIGMQFERQEREIEHDRLKLERQEELLKANSARLEDYKRGADARGSLSSPAVNTPAGYRGSKRAVPYSSSEPEKSQRVEPKLVPITTPAKVVATERKRVEPALEVVEEKKLGEDLLAEAPAKIVQTRPSSTLPPPAGVEEPLKVPAGVEKSARVEAPAVVENTVARTTTPPPPLNDADCTKASQEFSRAKSSVSDADRLFYLRRALRLCPSNAAYHVEVGKIYNRLGRTEDADHEFRQALDLEPNNTDAKKELAKLSESAR